MDDESLSSFFEKKSINRVRLCNLSIFTIILKFSLQAPILSAFSKS